MARKTPMPPCVGVTTPGSQRQSSEASRVRPGFIPFTHSARHRIPGRLTRGRVDRTGDIRHDPKNLTRDIFCLLLRAHKV
jgi:hypothetical protein